MATWHPGTLASSDISMTPAVLAGSREPQNQHQAGRCSDKSQPLGNSVPAETPSPPSAARNWCHRGPLGKKTTAMFGSQAITPAHGCAKHVAADAADAADGGVRIVGGAPPCSRSGGVTLWGRSWDPKVRSLRQISIASATPGWSVALEQHKRACHPLPGALWNSTSVVPQAPSVQSIEHFASPHCNI